MVARTGPELEHLQRERGICSKPDCDQPIEGWCATCDVEGPFRAPKLCTKHLAQHCIPQRHTPCLPWKGGEA